MDSAAADDVPSRGCINRFPVARDYYHHEEQLVTKYKNMHHESGLFIGCIRWCVGHKMIPRPFF